LEVGARVEVVSEQEKLHSGKQAGFIVAEELDTEALRLELTQLKEAGFESLAISLMHAYIYPVYEEKIAEIASEVGIKFVTKSSDIN
jgi:5-oxoprolinase (ATP-hydrolysing)